MQHLDATVFATQTIGNVMIQLYALYQLLIYVHGAQTRLITIEQALILHVIRS